MATTGALAGGGGARSLVVKYSRRPQAPGNVHAMARRPALAGTTGEKYSPPDEATVVDLLATYLRLGFAGRSWRQQRELVVGSSIADLVLFSAGARTFRFPEPLSVAESVMLSLLRRRGSVGLDELEAACGNATAKRSLRRLGVMGLVRTTGPRVSAARRWWTSGRVLAIEAKLSRWRDALDQAIRYRSYADMAYVALPEAHVRAALRAEDEFVAAGVGLLEVNASRLRRVIEASPAAEHDWRREFVHSRLSGS